MDNQRQTKLNAVVNHGLKVAAFLLLGSVSLLAETTWDAEKLDLEVSMQKRVESALAKLITHDLFLLVVRVEPWNQPMDELGRPIEINIEDGFFLPGVPARKRLDGSTELMKDMVESLRPDQKSYQHFIKRITATLVLDKDLPDETVNRARELTRQILGLEPARGDMLEVQRTAFNKVAPEPVDNSGISRLQRLIQSYWLIVGLSLIVFCIVVFLLFMFGPLRGFLNRFVQVLPTLKPADQGGRYSRYSALESQILPALLQQAYGLLPGGVGPYPQQGSPSFSGSLLVENPNKKTSPFSFVREDHLSNLAMLLSRESPEKAAVVLGYLPAEWISRVLSKLDVGLQTEITEHLATTRQLLPEQVEDIEQDLKRRLDYMVGGPDRLLAVYESLDPMGQKKMIDNLKEIRPDLAEDIMQQTFSFEALAKLEAASMKVVLREVELPTLVMALKGVPEEFRAKVLENLSPGKAEIVKEELEFSDGPVAKGTYEAQKKVAILARRLEREGQISIPKPDPTIPSARFSPGVKSPLKLPEGLSNEEPQTISPEIIEPGVANNAIEDRIREFMNRRIIDRERYPQNPKEPRIDKAEGE